MLPTKYYKLKKKKKRKKERRKWYKNLGLMSTPLKIKLKICVCVCLYIYIYIYLDKVEKKSNWVLIRFSILRHVSYLIFNFVSSELLSVKNELKNGKI